MSNLTSFKEYLNKDGKLQEKPIVDPKADTAPEPTRTPPTPKSGDTPGSGGKPAAYKTSTSDAAAQKGEKGFANQGDKKLEYNPKIKENPNPDDWEKKDTWPKGKTKTEEFIEKTSKMSLPEFAKHMISTVKPGDDAPTLFAAREGNFRPNPYEAVRYVTHLAINNEVVMESLVMEFIRRQGLVPLMTELFKHKKTYEEAVAIMDEDRFVNTIREMTAPPAAETEGDDDEPKTTSSAKKQTMGKAAKGRATQSVAGDNLDMADSGVVGTKVSMRMKKK